MTEQEKSKCIAQITEEDKLRCISELRDLILGNEILKKLRTDDLYLLRFLYCTDFDVQSAFQWMEEYCDLLIDNPTWFASGSPEKWKSVIETNSKVMIKARDPQGRRIFINKSCYVASSKTNVEDQAILDELWIEAVLNEPETVSTGVSYIVDMKGFSFKLLGWLTPHNLRIGKRKEALYPCKDLVYHIVNTNAFMSATMKLVSPFLSEKMKKKLIFHYTDWDSLHQHINPEVLPPEYGGTGPEIDYESQKKWLYEQSDQLKNSLIYNRIIDTI